MKLFVFKRDDDVFEYNFDEFEHFTLLANREYFVALYDDRPVGILSYKQRQYSNVECLSIGLVEVLYNFKKMGIATTLLTLLFTEARERGLPILNFSYEDEGRKYIRPKLLEMSEKYNVSFYEVFS